MLTANALLGISPKHRESALRPSVGCDGRFLFWLFRVLCGEQLSSLSLVYTIEGRGWR